MQIALVGKLRIRQIQEIPQLWKDVDPGITEVEDG